MEAGAERSRVEQSDRAMFCSSLRRNKPDAADLDWPWAQDPHRVRIPSLSLQDPYAVRVQCAHDLVFSDMIRHQRGDAPVRSALDVQRAQIDQPLEQIVRIIIEIYSVWQVYSPPMR